MKISVLCLPVVYLVTFVLHFEYKISIYIYILYTDTRVTIYDPVDPLGTYGEQNSKKCITTINVTVYGGHRWLATHTQCTQQGQAVRILKHGRHRQAAQAVSSLAHPRSSTDMLRHIKLVYPTGLHKPFIDWKVRANKQHE